MFEGGTSLGSCGEPPQEQVIKFTGAGGPIHKGSIRVTMELQSVRLEIPENGNIILGQSHFIKTVEDIYEAIVEHSTPDEVRGGF